MKYIINQKKCGFCGWEGLPFAIRSDEMRNPVFINREQFVLLSSCDGLTDMDSESLKGDIAKFFDWAISSGLVLEAPENARLHLYDYKFYPCKYRSDVQLSITGKCNYKCRHCFQSAPHGELGEPTAEQVFEELDQLAECGIINVSITGGEPLIHHRFWDIVDHLVENGQRLTTMYSNGKLVNRNLVEGAEEAALDAINLLVLEGFSVGCAYTLTRRTLPVFRETINLLASMGVHSVKSGCTQEQGEWLNCKDEWLTDQDYLDFYKEYIPQYLSDSRPLNLQFEGLFSGTSDKTLNMSSQNREKIEEPEDRADENVEVNSAAPDKLVEKKKKYNFMHDWKIEERMFSKYRACGVLGTSFYIGPQGRVLPCMSMDATPVAEQFPTLWEVPLKEILSEGSRFIETTGYTMRDVFEHNEECKDCKVKSKCGSGCRASAIGSDGSDYLALDKRTCLLCKEDWAGQIKKFIAINKF